MTSNWTDLPDFEGPPGPPGPQGPAGPAGSNGTNGTNGSPGPNVVSSGVTSTDISGIIKGDGSVVSTASPGTDYIASESDPVFLAWLSSRQLIGSDNISVSANWSNGLKVNGQSLNFVPTTTVGSSYNVLPSDDVMLGDASSNNPAFYLPPITLVPTGKIYTFRITVGSNFWWIYPYSGDFIEGGLFYINPYPSTSAMITLISDGASNWWIINHGNNSF